MKKAKYNENEIFSTEYNLKISGLEDVSRVKVDVAT